MIFNYFLRNDKRSGNKIHMYWFFDRTGKRVQKTCKNPDGNRCTSKKNALEYIARLEMEYAKQVGKKPVPFFSDFANKMFLTKSPHLLRAREHGQEIKENTRATYRRNINTILIPLLGSLKVSDITSELVDDALCALRKDDIQPYSGSFKNSLLYTLTAILKEAKRERFIDFVPDFEVFARKTRRQDILSDSELEILFTHSLPEIKKIWGRSTNDLREQPYTGLMLCALSCVAVSAGLRSGEVRALHMEQLYPQLNGLIIDKAFDGRENLGFLKKGNETDPRCRVVILPEKTWTLLDMYLKTRGYHDGFVFEYFSKPLTQSFLQHRFDAALKNTGIYREDRKTTFHALRYTYNTKMRRLLDAETLRDFIGHKNESMTDHYDRPILEQLLQQHHRKQQVINQFWSAC